MLTAPQKETKKNPYDSQDIFYNRDNKDLTHTEGDDKKLGAQIPLFPGLGSM